MQTILGAGGPVGRELAKALRMYTNEIRLVSRKPQKVHREDELHPADLLVLNQVERAVEGSEVVYLTAGLEYNRKSWERQWPQIISNVIKSCIEYEAKLVFLTTSTCMTGKALAT